MEERWNEAMAALAPGSKIDKINPTDSGLEIIYQSDGADGPQVINIACGPEDVTGP